MTAAPSTSSAAGGTCWAWAPAPKRWWRVPRHRIRAPSRQAARRRDQGPCAAGRTARPARPRPGRACCAWASRPPPRYPSGSPRWAITRSGWPPSSVTAGSPRWWPGTTCPAGRPSPRQLRQAAAPHAPALTVAAGPIAEKTGHDPRRTCEPWPLAQAGQIRPAPLAGAIKPGARPADRLARQPERRQPNRRSGRTQAPDLTRPSPQDQESRARSTIHTLPAESECLTSCGDPRRSPRA
jgi:hypothetical protein